MKKQIIWLLVTIAVVFGLLYWIYRLKEDISIIGAEKQKTETATKIDSVTVKQSEVIEKIKTDLQNSADAATNLIKKLPNEKTTFNDTSYSAMCDYLRNFRPD